MLADDLEKYISLRSLSMYVTLYSISEMLTIQMHVLVTCTVVQRKRQILGFLHILICWLLAINMYKQTITLVL